MYLNKFTYACEHVHRYIYIYIIYYIPTKYMYVYIHKCESIIYWYICSLRNARSIHIYVNMFVYICKQHTDTRTFAFIHIRVCKWMDWAAMCIHSYVCTFVVSPFLFFYSFKTQTHIITHTHTHTHNTHAPCTHILESSNAPQGSQTDYSICWKERKQKEQTKIGFILSLFLYITQ